ncbi:MAG: hypothetical protein A2770_00845 [Candidatus Levybacteria bacterium RIFCSPHIGHO2_01_FULL_38_12]|nr:MAG: hypothetical protein A2770_00845 [Candidatus Levybacteria bacterium RIFCSPHIGHO2_01_FULL_38_12]
MVSLLYNYGIVTKRKGMDKRDYIIILFLFVIGIVTRFPFVERMQSHWDGPQWSIGIIRYSLIQETPAPPGYPLYIALGKVINYIIHDDPHSSLIWISVLSSAVAASLFYVAGKIVFNKTVGLISSLLYLSGPTFYFFGLTAYPYGLLVVNSILFGLIVYYITIDHKQWGSILGILFAYILGIRPQEFIFLFPLFFYALYYLSQKQRRIAGISFVVFVFIWFIPLISASGGTFEYIRITSEFAKKGAFPYPTAFRGLNDYMMLVKGLFLFFGLGTLFLPYYVFTLKNNKNRVHVIQLLKNKIVILFILWIVPSLLFNLFIRSDHAGHQMTYLSGILLLVTYAVWKVLCNRYYFSFVVIVLMLFNLFTFFRDRDPQLKKSYIPTSFHYSEIRKNDIRLSAKIKYIMSNFQPKETLLVTSSNLWRPIMYYLPEFLIYDIPGITSENKKFKHILLVSKKWSFEEKINKNLSFHIPLGFRYLIFIDDESNDWKINTKIKKVVLKGNAILTIMKVKEYDNFLYKKDKITQL